MNNNIEGRMSDAGLPCVVSAHRSTGLAVVQVKREPHRATQENVLIREVEM